MMTFKVGDGLLAT